MVNNWSKRRWIAETRRDIKRLTPRQRQLRFAELHNELPDDFFALNFSTLFLDICQFVQDGFGTKTFGGTGSLWNREYPEEFIHFVKKIARPGSDGRQWDSLLRDGVQRGALLQGVIMMILEINVFSSLLFGAAPEHTEILTIEDTSMIYLEGMDHGFGRTSVRAATNKAYLHSNGGSPPLFWIEVDRVATQIMHLLIHVYDAIGENIPVSGMSDPFSMYQRMHDIVAHAGWLSVAVQLSPQITTFEWLSPGELYHHDHVLIAEEKSTGNSRNHRQPRGRPRVMISVAPKITRYDRESTGFPRGKKAYTVMRHHMACYFGQWQDWEDEDALMPLSLYISNRKPSRPRLKTMGLCIVLAFLLWGPIVRGTFDHFLPSTSIEVLGKLGLQAIRRIIN